MKYSGVMRVCCLLLATTVVACDRAAPPAVDRPATRAPAATTPAPAPVADGLDDVVETTSAYVIGISYPRANVPYPGLAAEMRRYADTARDDLLKAAQARDDDEAAMLYDLTLSFSEVAKSPMLVAYAADGSSFTGGAHAMPLLARFVWLREQDQRLTSEDLIPSASGWQAVSIYVREQLHTALSQRVDADELAPGVRAEVVRGAGKLIDAGTGGDPDNYAHFEPVVDVSGKVTALRFVFAPYQVGPYSDGIQTVDVPASVLLPHVAPKHRALFSVPAG